MKSEQVARAWEFYRDNCGGFKEPLRKEMRKLDDYVASVEAENDRLREELAKARDPQRIGGQADPSSFVYAIEQLREFRWQHATNDENAIPYINNVAAAHERENAKLRELATSMYDYVTKREMELCNACTEADGEYAGCEACDDYDGACGIAKKRFEELYERRMRELGIEVSK